MIQTHAFRLLPGQDLKKELATFCQQKNLKAATLTSGVGSLKVATIRLADGKAGTSLTGPFEIISLMGTLGLGGIHLHMSIADREGRIYGGHLMDGCTIHTTAEIVLLEHVNMVFDRELDPATGYKELAVRRNAE